jgi:hypothetical protein
MSEEAVRALSHLREISPEMRGGAILDSGGDVLAASGDRQAWRKAAGEMLAAADAPGEPVTHAHVATEDGEAFCVREDGLVAVAVTERFVLASLMVFDLRAVLRDLAAARVPA